MVCFGDKSNFAIECQVSRNLDNQPYINFRLWIDEKPIGDYEDEIPLFGCTSYLINFLKFSETRYEADLENKSKEEVFDQIFNSVIFTFPEGLTMDDLIRKNSELYKLTPAPYEKMEERFHLDPLGLSSFADKFNVILVEKKDRRQRLIWRNLFNLELHEKVLEPQSFESVAAQFLEWSKTKK